MPIDGNGDDPPSSPVEAVPFSAQQFPMKRPSVPHQTHGRRRLRSPGLKWYKQYDGPDCFLNGRVLVIDYIKQGTIDHVSYAHRDLTNLIVKTKANRECEK